MDNKNVLGELLRHHDDNLQHVGVKGMKWGVRRASGKVATVGKKVASDVKDGVKKKANDVKDGIKKKYNDRKDHGSEVKDIVKRRKSGEITRKQAREERWNSLHKYKMNDKKYKKSYDKQIAKGRDPKAAIRRAYIESERKKRRKLALARAAAVPLTFAAIVKGKDFLGK